MTLDRVVAGDDVALVVDAAGGDGQDVSFTISDGAGAEVTRLFAPIAAGTARATWRVDPGDRPLPVVVRFEARAGDSVVGAGELTIGPAGVLGAVGLVILPPGSVALDPGQLGELQAGPPPAPSGPMASYGSTKTSDLRAIAIDVAGARRQPLAGELALIIRIERERTAGRGDWAVERNDERTYAGAPARQLYAVHRLPRLTMPGEPRRRIKVSWKHRPGEAETPAADRDEHTVEEP